MPNRYENVILAEPGLLAYWPCDDAVGTVAADLSGHGHPLTVANTADATLGGATIFPWTPSAGTSLALTGNSATPASSATVMAGVTDTNGQSVEWWIQFPPAGDTYATINDLVMALTGTATGHLDRYHVDLTAYPTHFSTARQNTFGALQSAVGLHHYLYTRKTGGNFKQYIDGVRTGVAPSLTYGPIGTFVLGGNGIGIAVKGRMGHAALYNAELTMNQALSHYISGISSTEIYIPFQGNQQPWDIPAHFQIAAWFTQTYMGGGSGTPPAIGQTVVVAADYGPLGVPAVKYWTPVSSILASG